MPKPEIVLEDKTSVQCSCSGSNTRYAIGHDKRIGYYVKCAKCLRVLFISEDINEAIRERDRLNGKGK